MNIQFANIAASTMFSESKRFEMARIVSDFVFVSLYYGDDSAKGMAIGRKIHTFVFFVSQWPFHAAATAIAATTTTKSHTAISKNAGRLMCLMASIRFCP